MFLVSSLSLMWVGSADQSPVHVPHLSARLTGLLQQGGD
jgi:hypothetical protein